jgi:hypothetical protein
MTSASFEARLIPQRSTWAIIRVTWMPLGLGLLVMILSKVLEPVSIDLATAVGMLSGIAFVGGVLYIGLTWRRGPMLAVGGGMLGVGARRAPLADVGGQVGEYVFQSRSAYSPGTFWMPMLTMRFADGHELRIGCEGGGGPATGRAPTTAPHYLLPAQSWNQLVAALGARASA